MPSNTNPTQLVEGSVESDLVPVPIEYYAILPPNYDALKTPVPLVLSLHGGGGSREALREQQPQIESMFDSGKLPPMMVVTPSVKPRCFYVDFKDGSEKWESFLVGPFLKHLRERFNIRQDRQGTLVTGISMGGMGSLRFAFKHPDVFGAVAALEPAIEPALDWKDVRFKNRFYRSDEVMETIFGKPVDREAWNANNPATIAHENADEIRKSGLKVFFEAGDEDVFWLYEGAEFLHRVLWDQKIRHEYRLYYGADHVGSSVASRTKAAYEFLGKCVQERESDPAVEAVRKYAAEIKQTFDETDHYGIDGSLLNR